ncbi:MAG: TatD family hydrolase [Gammaproteobacteria bacterium]|nr:TatD family hydrolase [Gammaproteobacteria bacterium]
MLIDSHCHLDYLTSPDVGMDIHAILQTAAAAGVGRMLTVAVDRENQLRVLAHAQAHEQVFASVGIHPSSCAAEPVSVAELLALAAQPKVVAIGETGLDYYHGAEHAERQQQSFVTHLQAASRAGPGHRAYARCARTRCGCSPHMPIRCTYVMHCFTESPEMARAAMEMNFMISFSGIITFRSAAALREVVRAVPLDRMLVETDSPYLAPVPHRGRTNEPRHVLHVAEAVAAIKEIPVEEVAAATTANFYRLFPRAVVA